MQPTNETPKPAAADPGKPVAKKAEAGSPALAVQVDAVKGADMVTINVQRGEGDDEKDGIYVGINGQHDFVVPRGVDVSVPYPVYEVLYNAKRTMVNEDGSAGGESSRFAVALVGAPRRH